ncbi:MAG: Gldg family protein, partial [Desulfatibacillaceae bacterium]|nr:Gldg family protein [Desulfatibacillaceae bacterium]
MSAFAQMVKNSLFSFTGLVVLLAVLILANVLLSFASVRLDATEDKIYSLSPGTKTILQNLEQPVTFKVFYSASDPMLPLQIKAYARRFIEFLEEYERLAGGKITIERYDPKPDSDEEQWANKYGIEARTSGAGDRVYLGVVGASAEREEVLPFMDPSRERLLEYDITRMVVNLGQTQKKVIGIISSLPVFGPPAQPGMPQAAEDAWFFIQELKKLYEVKDLSPNANTIPEEIDLLFVYYPKFLGPMTPYAIDQYLLSGRNAIIYLDPMCLSDPAAEYGGSMRNLQSIALDEALAKWGFFMDPGMAVADMDQPTRVRNRFNVVEENPTWISVRGDSLNRDTVITLDLDTLLLPVVGALYLAEGSSLDWEPLLLSSTHSDIIDSFSATLGARTILQDFVSQNTTKTLAAKITGLIPGAFTDGPPEMDADDPTFEQPLDSNTHISIAKAPSTVILVADADNLADHYYLQRQNFMGFMMYQMFNDNLNFLLNSCELLTGGDALISIRSRGRIERPFTKVLELEAAAKQKWMDRERELMARAEEANQKLTELEQMHGTNQELVVSPELLAEIERFRDERTRINQELREVRKQLRADIERLGAILKFVNIFLMALVVS